MARIDSIIISFLISLLLMTSSRLSASQSTLEAGKQQPAKVVMHNVKTAQTSLEKISEITEYSLSAQITSLLEQSSHSPEKAEITLLNNKLELSQFNVAEQYLLLLIKAKIKQYYRQHQQAIELIEQAKLLRKHIAKQQLYRPVFSDLYVVLSKSLIAVNDFENGYQAKKTYTESFNDYSEAKHDKTIALLTEKYEIAHKIKANELLENQNKLEALQLGNAKKQQGYQERNLMLILAGLLVFIVLFLRQFQLRKKLLLLSRTDSLTGLLNRSALFVHGQKLVKYTIEQKKELSVLLFDIDHFKRVNDDYGHNVGDLVLMGVASLVNETMRSRDIFARLGGEEFVILLPDTDVDKAKAIAVRVSEKIAQHDFSYLGIKRDITLSIGVANINDTAAVFDDVLHAADLAMYQAKLQGRNRMANYATIAKNQERRAN